MTWCQYTPEYNEHAARLWERTQKWNFDTSHEISDVDMYGNRRRIATFKHSDDAALVEQLINAFHDGKLMIREE